MSDEALSPELLAELTAIGDRLRQRELCELYRMYRTGPPVRDEAAGGLYVYAEVDATTIATEVRRAAEAALAWAVDDLLLEFTPALCWFAPETDADRAYVAQHGTRDWRASTHKRHLDGFVIREDKEVWLSASLDADRARLVAAHECRHLDQHPAMSPIQAELDARHYEDRAERKMRAHTNV